MELENLVGEGRERQVRPMAPRERLVAGAIALGFLFAAGVVGLLVPVNRGVHPLTLGLLVLLAVVARRVMFEIGNNEACPDQLVFIPMLILAPLPLVPLLVAAAFVLARLPDLVRGHFHPDRWLYALGDAWHSIGAVAVLAALYTGPLDGGHIWVYGLALLGQAAVAAAIAIINDFLIHRTSPLDGLSLALLGCRIDAVLTPVAYMIAAVAQKDAVAVLSVVPVLWLLRIFSVERRERYAAALELNQAYRGTVMVLSDVVEAEDNYTASHRRSLGEMASAVPAEHTLGPRR